jgi:3-hydroxy-3-methylglutaryl CoA synthase
MTGITAYGCYIPRCRISRMTIIQNMAWYFPVIMAVAGGEKAIANWDEDALTMAVEAAFDCMASKDRKKVDGFLLASTTLPFADRLNASIAAAALNLREEGLYAADFSACQKAGTTACLAALDAVASGARTSVLVAASDQRRTKMATMSEMFYGDGAASLLFGTQDVIAEFMGGYSLNCDFVDHYRGYGKEFDYGWEERWVRDEGYGRIIPMAIRAFLEKHSLKVQDFSRVVYPCYFTGTHKAIAKDLGIDPSRLQDNLHGTCGDTGTAHPLLMLASALEDAQPGDRLLVAGFGQGCDVLGFRVTENMERFRPARGVRGCLASRLEFTNYLKFAKFRDLITADLGIRGEANPNTSLTVLWRRRRMILGFTGCLCTRCGTPQFPPMPVCVNPNCQAAGSFEDYEFSQRPAAVEMFTGDLLAPSVDPPAVYGLVTFEGGGKAFVDFTDCELGQVRVGMPAKMVFRRRTRDSQRGFTGYFWKAVPQVQG